MVVLAATARVMQVAGRARGRGKRPPPALRRGAIQ